MIRRPIPSTTETIPVIGLGTWRTFDVPASGDLTDIRKVLAVMNTSERTVIDSSPMYGRAEETVGLLTPAAPDAAPFFYATKVWTRGKEEGIRQMEHSFSRYGRPVMDLMQIHNLVDWKIHLPTLRKWKDEGKIRYIGITHYTSSMHEELERILRSERIDFVQFNYSMLDRHAEERLLPAAAGCGVATLINRPFGEGSLFNKVKGKALPSWARDYEISTWAQFFLKFIVSHPAVTCVIPATANPSHALDNQQAGSGPLPDEAARKRMVQFLADD